MVLEKDELIERLNHEVRILLHLVSKVRPADLDYRPAPRQRSLQDLLEYLTVFPVTLALMRVRSSAPNIGRVKRRCGPKRS